MARYDWSQKRFNDSERSVLAKCAFSGCKGRGFVAVAALSADARAQGFVAVALMLVMNCDARAKGSSQLL